LREPFTVTTDIKGVAALNYLPGMIVPLSIRVAGPGVAPHTLLLDASQGKDIVLKLGRPGRVVGIVRTASGAPLAGVPVELWVQGSGTLPTGVQNGFADRRITADTTVRLEAQPLKTGPEGAFQTPPTLLDGSSYRVSIRHDGFVPFVSDWVTLNGERAAIPAIRLQPLRQVTGQINDRQGRPVAGARVFVPASGPATATDPQGRFTLAGINQGKTVILVQQTGYRLQGWLIDPLAHAEVGPFTLLRTSEAVEPVMKPLAEPIPAEESRALANRLLEPFLHDGMEKGDDHPKLDAISALGEFDLDRALELLQNGKFRDENLYYQQIRGSLAAKLAEKAPARAEAMIEPITNPQAKVAALISVANALPASERARKQALLERATTMLRDRPQQANSARRLLTIAEQWLDMAERDRARRVLEDWKPSRVSNNNVQTQFLGQLARLEPRQVIAQLQEMPIRGSTFSRNRELAEVAVQLAIDQPAEAEQVINLQEAGGDRIHTVVVELRLCRRMARVDPPRARRFAASQSSTGTRACAWASVAFGLAEKDKAGASEALDRAIEEIDRLRESGPAPEQVDIVNGIRLMPPTNPAVLILPVVERIAPERLADVFWRAVALHPRIETDREDLLQSSFIAHECTLLARYDRDIAAALFEPMDSYLQSPAARQASWGFINIAIRAKVCIDPRGAVARIDSLNPPGDLNRSNPAYMMRLTLAELLGQTQENRWMRLWRFMGAQLDD
jgi:CarboxypepD_reg-like domain